MEEKQSPYTRSGQPADCRAESSQSVARPEGRPQYLTLADAAKMLGVTAETLRRRIRSGILPAKRLRGTAGGGRETILVEQDDVVALLEDYTGAESGG